MKTPIRLVLLGLLAFQLLCCASAQVSQRNSTKGAVPGALVEEKGIKEREIEYHSQSIVLEHLPEDGFEFLRNLPQVTSLEVRQSSTIPADRLELPPCPSLRVLALSGCQGATVETFRSIARLPSLEVLSPPTPKEEKTAIACLSELARCPKLRELSTVVGDADEGLEVLTRIPTLEIVAASVHTFAGFQHLAKCRRLRELDIGIEGQFTLDHSRVLGQMPALARLSIGGTESFAKGALAALSACKHLSALSVSVHEVGGYLDRGREELAAIQTLISLEIATHITAEELRHLSKLPLLRKLIVLACFDFDDKCLDAVRELPLEDLELSESGNLSAEAMAKLFEMPHLRVLTLDDASGKVGVPKVIKRCALRRFVAGDVGSHLLAWMNLLSRSSTGLTIELASFDAHDLDLSKLSAETRLAAVEFTEGYARFATPEFLEEWRAFWPNVRIDTPRETAWRPK